VRLPISDYYKRTSYLSLFPSNCRLIVKFSLSKGSNFFSTPVRDEPLNRGYKMWPQKQRTIKWCKTYFDVLNRLGVAHESDRQTDKRTDKTTVSKLANSAVYRLALKYKLSYIAA